MVTLPTLPPHPGVYIASPAALASYLRARGVRHFVKPDLVRISLDLGEFSDSIINVYWLDDQVRFVAQAKLDLASTNLAEAALAVERLNEEIGFPVWRVLPSLSVTYTATLDHDGMLSSRVLEYAIARLRHSLEHDQPVLSATLGIGPP